VASVTNSYLVEHRADLHIREIRTSTKNFRDICSSLQACAVVEHWNSSLSTPLFPVHSTLNNMCCWNSIIKHYLRAVQVDTAATLHTCILEVLGLDIGYPNWGSSQFSSVSPGKFQSSASSRPRPLIPKSCKVNYLWFDLAFEDERCWQGREA
jgi:hypothetical protein